MATSLKPSLYILLVMVAVLLFISVRNIRDENRKLSMEMEVTSTVLLQAEERRAVCKADLSSQKQVMQEMKVATDKRKVEVDSIEEKVKVCNNQMEEMKLKSLKNKNGSEQL
eukprot:GFUD01106163.1.p1 GENE.GFUD01106163.1~~GFUD01106163.1.p1  ORF type:complete len:112 (-),score=51.59 GFUD01106163.1:16-351(-)